MAEMIRVGAEAARSIRNAIYDMTSEQYFSEYRVKLKKFLKRHKQIISDYMVLLASVDFPKIEEVIKRNKL